MNTLQSWAQSISTWISTNSTGWVSENSTDIVYVAAALFAVVLIRDMDGSRR